MKEDMLVKARFKDAPESEWFDVLLTDDHRMLRKDTMAEITRTDLLFKADDDSDEIIDMDKEWEEYKREKVRDRLHDCGMYLAAQAKSYANGKKYECEHPLVPFFEMGYLKREE